MDDLLIKINGLFIHLSRLFFLEEKPPQSPKGEAGSFL
jgi:hypothetical protein